MEGMDKDRISAMQAANDILRAEVARLRSSIRQGAAMHRKDALFYQMLVESMAEGLMILDEQGKIIYANQALYGILQYGPEEMIGHSPQHFLDPDEQQDYPEKARHWQEGGQNRFETVWRAKHGEKIFTLVAPSPFHDDSEKFRGTFAVITDLTEQRRMAEALDEERRRLRALMDNLPDPLYVKDREGRYVSVNAAKLRALGTASLHDVLGKTALDYFPLPAAREYHEEDLELMQRGIAKRNVLHDVMTPDGQQFSELSSKAPLRDASGAVVGLVGISRDVTMERNALAALEVSERRFREILDHSRDIVYKVDLSTGAYEFLSPSTAAMIGLRAEEVVALGAEGLEALIPKEERANRRTYFELILAGAASPSQICEYRMRRRNGEYGWFSEIASIVRDESDNAVARIGTIRDISWIKQAEEAMRMASRMEATATLAGGIAHDFNNLMAAVLGNAELLEMKFSQDADSRRMLRAIAKAAVQAGNLTQQMLAFAQGGKYAPSLINLNQVIEEVLRLEQHSFPKNIRCVRELSDDLWHMMADPAQMSQIILNISMNAVEAMTEGGELRYLTSNHVLESPLPDADIPPGRYVRLRVQDTGHGMPEAVRARVFEPFFTTRFQGRGLGLAAVYGIVQHHSGHIRVFSNPGEGSVFEILLPAMEARVSAPPKKSNELPIGHETILLVDDEDLVVSTTRQILERLGYTVLLACNGQEAVDLAQSHAGPIHLTLLDMAMPIMGGAEAFPLLMKARPKMKVIICSGFERDAAAQHLMDLGAAEFLHKPVRTRVLATAIRQALDDKKISTRAAEKPGKR